MKTATARMHGVAMEGQFSVAEHQIAVPRIPELHFIFCFRLASGYWRFAATKQKLLNKLLESGKLGKENRRGQVVFRLRCIGEKTSMAVSRAVTDDVTAFFVDAWKLRENVRGA